MSSNFEDDRNLASRIIDGDPLAFDDFYTRYADLLFSFIYHLVDGSRADAEDIWQDTFIAAFRALPYYRGQSRLSSWLCGIARHKAIDFRRHRRTKATVSPRSSEHLLELMDAGPLPDEVLERGDTRALVVEAIGGLPAECRDVLIARYLNELPIETIARQIGRSYKATESLLSRGRAKLRDLLKNFSEESS